MAAPVAVDKITLNFGWKGPSSWRGGWSRGGLDVGVVDLTFKDVKTDISVLIPDNTSPSTVQKFPFTCRKYHENELELDDRKFKSLAQETYPDSLKVTVEQIYNLTIKAGIFEKSPNEGPAIMDSSGKITREKRILRSDREIKLEVPKKLEVGQTYSLVITSNDFSLSALLLKEERIDGAMESEKKVNRDEFQNTKPSERSSDLDMLTADELQSRFEATFKKDKEFESQRMQYALAGNIKEMSKITEVELANSQVLIGLSKALERKGIKAQIPQSAEAVKGLAEACKVQ